MRYLLDYYGESSAEVPITFGCRFVTGPLRLSPKAE